LLVSLTEDSRFRVGEPKLSVHSPWQRRSGHCPPREWFGSAQSKLWSGISTITVYSNYGLGSLGTLSPGDREWASRSVSYLFS
jgi:hypothetical protein